jgi:hypothetical protein
MYIFGDIKNWIKRKRCQLRGHDDVVTIEAYSVNIIHRNFDIVKGKFYYTPRPVMRMSVDGKHKCKTCHAVFIGVIVKEQRFQDIRYDT